MVLSIWLLLNGVVYLILGFMFVFQFETMAGSLGIEVLSGSAAIELITVYGGLETGLGVLFIMALFVMKYRLFSLQILTFSYLCFAMGRLAGMLGHDVASTMTYYLLVFEIVGFVVSALLLKKGVVHHEEG